MIKDNKYEMPGAGYDYNLDNYIEVMQGYVNRINDTI